MAALRYHGVPSRLTHSARCEAVNVARHAFVAQLRRGDSRFLDRVEGGARISAWKGSLHAASRAIVGARGFGANSSRRVRTMAAARQGEADAVGAAAWVDVDRR